MAEHYGVKPKMFTREWWPYYWMYYKWQTIGIALTVMCIVVTVVQCTSKTKYDATVNIACVGVCSSEQISALTEQLQPCVEDMDGNGENNLFIQQLNFINASGGEQNDYTLQMKHDVQFGEESSFLYIYDKTEGDIMAAREHAADMYMPVDEWADETYPDQRLLKTSDGTAIGVLLSDSAVLKEAGIEREDLYVTVRVRNEEDSAQEIAQRSAIKMANKLLDAAAE